MKEIKIGEIRPIHNIVGYHVCRKVGDTPETSEWFPVEKLEMAEILSFIYRFQNKTAMGKKKVEEVEVEKIKVKKKKSKKKAVEVDDDDEDDEEEDETDITDDDL